MSRAPTKAASAIALAIALLSLPRLAPANPAEEATTDEVVARTTTLSRSLMSPFCPGRTLQSCPSPDAATWVGEIRAWVAAGRSDDEIRQTLQARVPGFELGGEPSGSARWLVGVVPIALASLLLGLVSWRLVRRRRAAVAAQPDGAEPVDERLRDRLDDELLAVD